ncbi:Pex29p PWA37_000286 [Arxiozyma heterogenica]|uniref:Pex29p n=1 Tax=Arxiozyma heterogenica TaxID=278026 RepID=UPI002F0228D1
MDVVTNLWKGDDSKKISVKEEANQDSRNVLNEMNMYSAAKVERKNNNNINLNISHKASNINSSSDSRSNRSHLSSQGKSNSNHVDKVSSIQQMMTDTLVEKIIKMALPPSSMAMKDQIATRMVSAKNRPSLSVQLLSKNFIAMNSRLALPFMIIDSVIDFINWENIPMTLSIMCLYTLCILNPLISLTCGPLCYILFQIMVPHYMNVHLPNPTDSVNCLLEVNRSPAQGPPLKDPILPEPVPEFSQEFVMNLQDLQNHVLIYVVAYDFIYFIMKKFVFFINEQMSTAWFIILLGVTIFNYLFIDMIWSLIPIKLLLILLGWSLIILLYPKNRDNFMQKLLSEETRVSWLQITNQYEHKINEQLRFVEARENRVVNIFEIQVYKNEHKEWTSIGYYNDHYTLFSPLRLKEEKIEPLCVKDIDEIEPPRGWSWINDGSWELDLSPEIWVRENFINNVRIDSSTKWVYDKVEDFTEVSKWYRRRMWVRNVIREITTTASKTNSQGNNKDEKAYDNPTDFDEMTDTVITETNTGDIHTNRGKNNINNKEYEYDNNNHINKDDFDRDTSREEIEEVRNPVREDRSSSHISIRGIARESLTGAKVRSFITPTTSSSSTNSRSTEINTSPLSLFTTSSDVQKIKSNDSYLDKVK